MKRKVRSNLVWEDEQKKAMRGQKNAKVRAAEAQKPSKQPKTKKKKRKLKRAAITLAVIALIGGGAVATGKIISSIYNSTPPSKDPLTPDRVIDPNGNDFEFGDDGQIIVDDFTPEEKAILKSSFDSLILSDANSRSAEEIGAVDQVVSLSMFPYNLSSDSTFDKYCVSLLLRSGEELYSLNYLTSSAFESASENPADQLMDFINYLEYDCVLDTCAPMPLEAAAIQTADAIKDYVPSPTFVGETFLSKNENGEYYYFIPVYGDDGSGTLFYTWESPITAVDGDPTQMLISELSEGGLESFSTTAFLSSQALYQINEIYSHLQDSPEAEEELEK